MAVRRAFRLHIGTQPPQRHAAFCLSPDPALPQSFRKLTSADLQPVFEVDIKRETRRLTSDHTDIEVSLDSGAVIAGEQREPVHEIELELVAGSINALFAEDSVSAMQSTGVCIYAPRPT